MSNLRSITSNETYHVMNKSIAGYQIFNTVQDFQRMIQLIRFFQYPNMPIKFSYFLEHTKKNSLNFESALEEICAYESKQIEIVAYCLMPTHFHIIVNQLKKDGIANFMSNISNSYARYFNITHKRQGHLWMGRFKHVHITTDEQLIHTIRYLHINATTAKLVKKPEQWEYSSYKEYILPQSVKHPLCNADLIQMTPAEWKEFTEDNISYQQELAELKSLWLE